MALFIQTACNLFSHLKLEEMKAADVQNIWKYKMMISQGGNFIANLNLLESITFPI